MKRGIRFGIMCDGTTFPRWQAETILNLLEMEEVTPGLLIINEMPQRTFFEKAACYLSWRKLLWTFYILVVKSRLKSSRETDLSKVLHDVRKIRCKPQKKGKYSQYFCDSDIDKIKEADLDFILRFSFGIIRGDILSVARYGIWSFHHDDEMKYRGSPSCFWEIYHDDTITAAVLQRLTSKLDSGVVLYKGFFKTQLSYARNRDLVFLESAKWPALLCVDILNNNLEKFSCPPSNSEAPIYTIPSNIQLVRHLLRSGFNKLREFLKWFFFVDYWNIGVADGDISRFLSDQKPEVKWFPLKSKDIFIADPFAICDNGNNGKLHIFLEAYDFKKAKGIIQYTSFESEFSQPVTVIEEGHHLSYPYIFKDKGEISIIPECFRSRSVALYKPVAFPYSWERNHELITRYEGVDNTVLYKDGKYWMFTSDRNEGLPYNLKIFYADKLTGEWMPHAKNPVKSDIRNSRSAGTLFEYDNSLYRPSMDNSERNQGRIVINKIVKLSTTEFEEIPVRTVYPYEDSFYPDKIHTLCSAGNYTVIDGARRVFILSTWRLFIFRMKQIVGKVTSI